MVTFSEAQLAAWLSPIMWPFVRTLAMMSTAPVLSSRAVPVRVKIALASLVALCAQPSLAPQMTVGLDSPLALETLLQQVGVGMALGMAVRIMFACVGLVGELAGLQMGLNFATFFDPTSNSQVSAVSGFYNHMASMLFVVLNGHMLVVMAVISSFDAFPVGMGLLDILNRLRLFDLGTELFSSALWLALPMIAALLLVNLGLGIISRVAPQMNIYAIGFPITLIVGLLGIAVTLPMLERPVTGLFEHALELFSR